MMLCPECLRPIRVHDGLVAVHRADGQRCFMSGLPPFTWTERATRQAVANRSGAICERCTAARGTEMHHRMPRSVGGQWSPANVVHLCHDCHGWVTENPASAHGAGLHLRSTEDPIAIPVIRASGMLVLLSDDVAPPRRKTHR